MRIAFLLLFVLTFVGAAEQLTEAIPAGAIASGRLLSGVELPIGGTGHVLVEVDSVTIAKDAKPISVHGIRVVMTATTQESSSGMRILLEASKGSMELDSGEVKEVAFPCWARDSTDQRAGVAPIYHLNLNQALLTPVTAKNKDTEQVAAELSNNVADAIKPMLVVNAGTAVGLVLVDTAEVSGGQ